MSLKRMLEAARIEPTGYKRPAVTPVKATIVTREETATPRSKRDLAEYEMTLQIQANFFCDTAVGSTQYDLVKDNARKRIQCALYEDWHRMAADLRAAIFAHDHLHALAIVDEFEKNTAQ